MSDAAPVAPAAPAGGPTVPGQGQPPTPGQKPGETPAQAERRRFRLNLDGKEVELDESELATNYRKGKDATKLLSKVEQRRQEALRAKAEADGILGKLKDKGNLRAVLRDLGYTTEDLRAMSQAEILEAIEEESLTPEQRRSRELERKLKEYEAEKQKAKQSEEEKAHAAEVERHKDELANLFLTTMEATGLPKSSGRFVMQRMAHLYAQNEEAGLDSTTEEMAAYVLQGLKREHQGVLSGLEGDALVEYLGPDVVRKVLGVHLAKARAKRGMGGQPPQQQPTTPAPLPTPAGGNPRKGRWAAIDAMG